MSATNWRKVSLITIHKRIPYVVSVHIPHQGGRKVQKLSSENQNKTILGSQQELVKTPKPTHKWLSSFGLIEENMAEAVCPDIN